MTYTLGLMSGTSVDSIDASLLLSQGVKDHVLLHLQFSYEKKLRDQVLQLIRNQECPLKDFTKLHYEIGGAFAHAAEKTIRTAIQKKMIKDRAQIFSIGSHGQTVFHDPEAKQTLQIGEGSLIAEKTCITTVSDFRMSDTAAGGEGAPLLPYYHRRLFQREAKKGIAIHNLGGISNFTYFNEKEIFALDTGPANCFIDGAIQSLSKGKQLFDLNGTLARKGKVHLALLNFLCRSEHIALFLRKPAPKSTGRELFSPKLLEIAMSKFPLSKEDLLRTLTQFTVDCILLAYKKEIRNKPLKQIIFAGGGSKNSFMLELLQKSMPYVSFFTMEDFGWNSQALESQAFAYYSYLAIKGLPITFPRTTGTQHPAICGKISKVPS